MLDCYGRSVHYLRVSVTDRCNLRCNYCMPESGVQWLDHSQILTYEEILRIVRAASSLGIDRIRLTGGEPLVRKDLDALISGLKTIPGIRWVGLTTNGILLEQQLSKLIGAGLDAVNISLDTLNREEYCCITRRDNLEDALRGLTAALQKKKLTVRVNCVPTKQNANQWVPLADLARERSNLDVRFIELMPIGLGRKLERQDENTVLERLEAAFGPAQICAAEQECGPSHYVMFPGFLGRVGFISAISHQFCSSCNRVRLTATGILKPCLQYESNVDLRTLMRKGASDNELSEVIADTIYHKPAAHHFGLSGAPTDEKRTMNQIGG